MRYEGRKYEGKTKIVEIKDDHAFIIYKDDITAGNGLKHDVLKNKGAICAQITAITMDYLNKNGIKTHFIEFFPPNKMKVIPLEMFQIEVVVRFVKAGSFIKRYGGKEGEELKNPIVEFFLKDDQMHDPMVCPEHLVVFGVIKKKKDIESMKRKAKEAASLLKDFFEKRGYDLWDIKFEFGRDSEGSIILGDEISPDTFRLRKGKSIFDKDIYRRNIEDPVKKYEEVLKICKDINL